MSSRRPSSHRPSGQPRGTSRSSAASAARRRKTSAEQRQHAEEARKREDTARRAERRRRAEQDVRKRAEKTRRAPQKPASKSPSQATKTTSRPGAEARGQQMSSPAPKDPRFTRQWNVVYGTGESTRAFPLRLLVMITFVAIAILVIATPLTRYTAQQEEKRTMLADLEDSRARVKTLEQEIARWEDPDFVQSQARERLGYVMPGQTLYLVPDPNEGTAEQRLNDRVEEVNRERRAATPFYVTMMDSIAIAGVVGAENPSDVPIIEDPNAPVTAEPGGEETSPATVADTTDAPASESASSDPAQEESN